MKFPLFKKPKFGNKNKNFKGQPLIILVLNFWNQ